VWALASRDASPGDLSPDLASHEGVRVDHIRLTPLSEADLAAIARDRLGQAPDERTCQFLGAAGGNPFLATQIIDGLARSAALGEPEAGPAEVSGPVAGRVAALPGASRDLVDLLAVSGRPLPMRDAA